MRCKCTEYKRDAEGAVEVGEVKDMKCLSFFKKNERAKCDRHAPKPHHRNNESHQFLKTPPLFLNYLKNRRLLERFHIFVIKKRCVSKDLREFYYRQLTLLSH